MIIVAVIACAALVLGLIGAILTALPLIDSGYFSYINQSLPYIAAGIKFMNYFINTSVVIPLGLLCILLQNVFVTYKIVLWVVKKIPFFGVSD